MRGLSDMPEAQAFRKTWSPETDSDVGLPFSTVLESNGRWTISLYQGTRLPCHPCP